MLKLGICENPIMKLKLFLSLVFFISLFLTFPTKISAQDVVRCATSGSVLCALRVNCPGDSNYSGYCCDNVNQCYNTTAEGPESRPGFLCGSDNKGINTALGCISFDAESGGFVRSLLGILIGLGGGVALLLILYGVFIVTTSAGIPDKLNSGKEIISSAVAGLVFIILAIFLMNLIGVKILALPGL